MQTGINQVDIHSFVHTHMYVHIYTCAHTQTHIVTITVFYLNLTSDSGCMYSITHCSLLYPIHHLNYYRTVFSHNLELTRAHTQQLNGL